MKLYTYFFCLLGVSASALGTKADTRSNATPPLIDLTDAPAVRARRPLLIAHRGGVITPATPECSLAAIRAAAHHHYAMVELDIQEAADGVPIVFHDRTLRKACGLDKQINDLTAGQLREIKYLRSDERVCDLDMALALCKRLSLGVMLDIKPRGSDAFFERIATSIRKHGLDRATVCISGDARIRDHLKQVALFRVTRDDLDRLQRGERASLAKSFWFGLPGDLPDGLIGTLQRSGALVIPAINTFRYDQISHRKSARRDVERLTRLGVDGFQIDSVYQDYFNRPRVQE